MLEPTSPPCECTLHVRFLVLLPRIELHAQIVFRDVRCPQQKDDAVAETVALVWKWFVRLAERGQSVEAFSSALVGFAARAVKNGRRLCGQEKAKDVLSRTAQRRHGFSVGRLPDYATAGSNPLTEALHDNTKSPPPDAAAFRCDFPAWLGRYAERDRRIAEDLMVGERTLDVSRKFGLSPARVSQKRREFHRDWQRFHGESFLQA